jgi:hypothetical protein
MVIFEISQKPATDSLRHLEKYSNEEIEISTCLHFVQVSLHGNDRQSKAFLQLRAASFAARGDHENHKLRDSLA